MLESIFFLTFTSERFIILGTMTPKLRILFVEKLFCFELQQQKNKSLASFKPTYLNFGHDFSVEAYAANFHVEINGKRSAGILVHVQAI